MKTTLAALLVMISCSSLHSQDFNTMVGDWMRVDTEYKDGGKLPSNHGSRILIRYHFTKKDVYLILSGNTMTSAYTRTGSTLKIAPIQHFVIEEYTDKALTLVEAEAPRPLRYYLITIDSFQRSGMINYPFEVVGADTIYTDTPGLEPIYRKGQNEFMKNIITGFSQQRVGFDFSYVIQKDGTIGEVTVEASSNPKLNKRLIQLVKKSSGKWIPARYKDKPVNVRLNSKLTLNNM